MRKYVITVLASIAAYFATTGLVRAVRSRKAHALEA